MSEPFSCELGYVLGDSDPPSHKERRRAERRKYVLDAEALASHALITGRTGSGKSRLLWKLIEEHVNQRRACVVIDPGDLAEDFLASVGSKIIDRGSDSILRRIHFLEVSPFRCFGYDPFQFRLFKPVHPELLHVARKAWLYCKADAIAAAFQEQQGQSGFQGMPRLQRMMRDILLGVGTLVEGKRLAMADALVLLDVTHTLHGSVYDKLEPHLPQEVRADFRVLHQLKRLEDVRRESESTLNRLRQLLAGLLGETLSHTGKTVDLFDVVQNGHCLLVHLRPSQFFPDEQATALGKLLIHDLMETVIATPRELRKDCTLIVDEAWKFASDELFHKGRNVLRKYKLACVFASLDLSSFRTPEKDYVPKVISQPNTIISFNMKFPEDAELMADVLFAKNRKFVPLVHEVQQSDGYEFIQVTERSRGVTNTTNWGDTSSTGTADGTQDADTKTKTRQRHASEARPLYGPYGQGTGSEGGSEGEANARVRGKTHQETAAQAHTEGGARAESATESEKLMPLAKTKIVPQKTGQLEESQADQKAKDVQTIMGLPHRQAVVGESGAEAFVIETVTMPDPFKSPKALAQAVEGVKRLLAEKHDYHFTPSLDPAEQERRVRDTFLSYDAPDADDPVVVNGDDEEADDGEAEKNGFGY